MLSDVWGVDVVLPLTLGVEVASIEESSCLDCWKLGKFDRGLNVEGLGFIPNLVFVTPEFCERVLPKQIKLW